jgi:pimeloyl-ACP methyl ester carboxylesterase
MQLNYTYNDLNKPVILMLHGFLGSAAQWNGLVVAFENDFSTLLVEMPGHGASPEADTQFSIDDIAHAINGILELEVITKVHVVGHSMGGYVGSAFAEAYTNKILSLTLINSITGPDATERKLLRDRAITLIEKQQEAYVSMAINNLFTEDERQDNKSQIKEMKVAAGQISIDSIVKSLKAMRDRSGVTGFLKDVKFPIHMISGSKDVVIPQEFVIEELMLLGATHTSLEGGHMLILTHVPKLSQKMHFIEN